MSSTNNSRFPNQKNILNNLTPQQMQQLQQMSGVQRNQFFQFLQQNNQNQVRISYNNTPSQGNAMNTQGIGSMTSLRQQLQNNQTLQSHPFSSISGTQNMNYGNNYYQPMPNTQIQGQNQSPIPNMGHPQAQMSPAMMNSTMMATPSPNPNVMGPSPLSNPQNFINNMMSPAKMHTPSPKPNTPLPHQPSSVLPNPSYFYHGKNIPQSQYAQGSVDNSPGIGTNVQMNSGPEDVVYIEKLKQLSKYVEPLRKLISKIEKEDDQKKEIVKLKALLDILSNSGPSAKKVPIDTLLKCEQVLARQFEPKDKMPIPNPSTDDSSGSKPQSFYPSALTPLAGGPLSNSAPETKIQQHQHQHPIPTQLAPIQPPLGGSLHSQSQIQPPPSVSAAAAATPFANVASVNLLSNNSVAANLNSVEGFNNTDTKNSPNYATSYKDTSNPCARFFNSLTTSTNDPEMLDSLEYFKPAVRSFLEIFSHVEPAKEGSALLRRTFGPCYRTLCRDDPIMESANHGDGWYYTNMTLPEPMDCHTEHRGVDDKMRTLKQDLTWRYLCAEMGRITNGGYYTFKIDSELETETGAITLLCFLDIDTVAIIPPLRISIPEKYPLEKPEVVAPQSDGIAIYQLSFVRRTPKLIYFLTNGGNTLSSFGPNTLSLL